MIEIIAAICSGTFFGAAVYINLAQHPATVQVGGEFAGKFFPPMYKKAATLQVFLAVVGTISGFIAWFLSKDTWWLVGGIFLISVIPITLLFIKPVNDQLLYPKQELSPEKVMSLLQQWNPRHWVRSIVSFASFLCYLIALSQ